MGWAWEEVWLLVALKVTGAPFRGQPPSPLACGKAAPPPHAAPGDAGCLAQPQAHSAAPRGCHHSELTLGHFLLMSGRMTAPQVTAGHAVFPNTDKEERK